VKPKGSDRFADLVGDARPLDRGPARRPPDADATTSRRARAADRPDSPAAAAGPAFRWPDPERRGLAAAPGIGDAVLARLQRGEPEPEERIDLHGTRREAAKRLLAQRIGSARAQGLRCVVVVHGQGRNSATGEAVLREAVPEWLAGTGCARHVLAFAPAPRRLGGDGATLVLLRKG